MELQELRAAIDAVDAEMLTLFLRRMTLSEEIARCKQERGLPVLNRTREREILAKVAEQSGDREMYAHRLFTTLFQLSRARQNELLSAPTRVRPLVEQALSASSGAVFPRSASVACQGVEGANSQVACDKLFPRANIIYVRSFEAVFHAVESGLCRYGVLPVENSSNGSVRAVYELLQRHAVSVVRSTRLCIRHELLAKPGVLLSEIRTIYSHEQAIGQCSRFLAGLPGVRVVPCANTAVAAQMVAEGDDPHAAAISSRPCAELYGLEAIGGGIQDSDNNYTRFICIAKDPVIYPGADRISLMIACDNRPGALCEILSRLAVLGVNMSKLESCPVPGSDFEFVFLLELDAPVQDPGVLAMLEDLERSCGSFLLLGCYAEV